MSQFISSRWVLTLACVAGVAANGVVFAPGGGGGPGGGGHGGGHMGGGGHVGGGHVGGGHHYGGGGYHHGGGGNNHYHSGGGYGGFYGGIGLYGFYPGYRYGNYGVGNGYYYNQPVYSQPVYTTPVYSQPIYSSPVYTGSSPVVSSQQVISTTPPVVYDNGEILLFSPTTNTQDVQYLLNGTSYTMKPGNSQKLTNDRTWTIDINTGNGQMVKYTLSTGRFKFKPSETGMGLFSTQDQPETAAPVPESVATDATDANPPTAAPTPAPGN